MESVMTAQNKKRERGKSRSDFNNPASCTFEIKRKRNLGGGRVNGEAILLWDQVNETDTRKQDLAAGGSLLHRPRGESGDPETSHFLQLGGRREEGGAQPLTETCLHTRILRNHSGAMGTVCELCLSSLQTFMSPAVETNQEPSGKVQAELSALGCFMRCSNTAFVDLFIYFSMVGCYFLLLHCNPRSLTKTNPFDCLCSVR